MPEYKKKHVNKLRGAPRPKKNKHFAEPETEDIVMSPAQKRRKVGEEKSSKPTDNMRVVKGRKLEQQRKTRVFTASAAIIVAVCVILHLILPVGIIENVQNLISLIGSGTYPSNLESSDVLNVQSRGMYYYILTDTRLNAYSNGGKEIYSYPHGYEHPVVKTSKTRALVFAQGQTEGFICNLQSVKQSIKSESEIITANISDSGVYAVVTRSESYASVVTVYSKNGSKLYEWYSAEDTVNNVAIAPNGKKIAVSSFNAKSGKYTSALKVLGFDSATPKYTESFDGTLIYDINTSSSGGFSVITENSVRFFAWSDYKKNEYKNDYGISLFRAGSGGSAAVFNRSSDRTDNRIAVFNSKGVLKNEFEFKGIISDIEISGGHIYCISDTKAYILSDSGTVLKEAECGFGAVRLSVIGTNTVAVITDNRVDKIKLAE